MYPTLTVFGVRIGVYGLCALLGFAAALGLSYGRARRARLPQLPAAAVVNVGLAAAMGGMAGAVLFRPLTRLPDMLFHPSRYAALGWEGWQQVLFGELVFYGGLIGGVAAGVLFCRAFRLPLGAVADTVAPGIPLGHAFGRVGCFFGGCCYGVQTHTALDVHFPFGDRLPIQLFEAAGEVLLCGLLLLYLRKPRRAGQGLLLYLLLYAALRFALEFWRGDAVRGAWAGLSTSQWVSLGTAAACGVFVGAVEK